MCTILITAPHTINVNEVLASGVTIITWFKRAGALILRIRDLCRCEGSDEPFTIATGGVSIIRGEVATLDAVDISSATNAQKAVAELDTLITNVAAGRAKYGAYINRLEYASDNLMNVAQNTDASRSQIEDADYAAETSELARTQIIAQASTAMLAQANQSKQSVLALLQ